MVARLDNLGDVLLSGPLVRAAARHAASVTYLCTRRGEAAARLLPGVDDVMVTTAGWIESPAPAVTRTTVLDLAEQVEQAGVDQAVILASFHQSPLPLALVLRIAGVRRIGAVSVDYAGSLLDVRHQVTDELHEVARALSLGAAMGWELPPGDPGGLMIRASPRPELPAGLSRDGYVVVHPGASVPARAADPGRLADAVAALSRAGHRVVVTGGPDERALTRRVAGHAAVDLGGRCGLDGLAGVLAGARVVVVGNTGPAHLAAAVGTAVVSLFAPTVPVERWHPWMVPNVILGRQGIACAGCRARHCPVAGHPCVGDIGTAEIVNAVDQLANLAEARR